jgi:hypothetical protein
MVGRLTRLTPRQEAAMPAHRDKWLRLGLSTEPFTEDDRRAVEQALRFWYRGAGLAEPRSVIFAPSPFTLRVASGVAIGAIHALRHGWPSGPAIESAVDAALAEGLGRMPRQAFDAADAAIHDSVDELVYSTVDVTIARAVDAALQATSFGIAVYEEVYRALNIGVDATAGPTAGSAVRRAVCLAIRTSFGEESIDTAIHQGVGTSGDTAGLFLLRCAAEASRFETHTKIWPGRAARYTFFRDCCDLEVPDGDALAAIEAIESRTSAISLHRDFAMVTERPCLMRRDAAGRLHAGDGPAIAYRDGWRLYFWHGRRLPSSHEWLIAERAQLTPDAIEAEPNAELRRVALEIFGFENYLAVRSARVIATDELHGEPRRLLEIMVRGEPIWIIEVTNGSLQPDGTRRRYHLGAMPGADPHEAIAASYGIAPAHYREAVRT